MLRTSLSSPEPPPSEKKSIPSHFKCKTVLLKPFIPVFIVLSEALREIFLYIICSLPCLGSSVFAVSLKQDVESTLLSCLNQEKGNKQIVITVRRHTYVTLKLSSE